MQDPFKTLSEEEIEKITSSYSLGHSPEEIGIKLGLDYDDVRFYCENFLKIPKSRYERLQDMAGDLEEVCEASKRRIDSGTNDSPMMLQSYQRLLSELRTCVAEMDGLKVPTDIVKDVVEKVLNPFIIGLAQACTEETNTLREELIKLHVPPRDAKNISSDVFRRLMVSVKTKMVSAEEGLNAYYGVKTKKNKKDFFGAKN